MIRLKTKFLLFNTALKRTQCDVDELEVPPLS
jgi:hypothetical protein